MATEYYVVYGATNDFTIDSVSGVSYAAASAGTGTLTAASATDTSEVFSHYVSAGVYHVGQWYLSFDTSAVPASVGSDSLAFSFTYGNDQAVATGKTFEAREHTWGGTTADWIAGASLTGKTLVATSDVTINTGSTSTLTRNNSSGTSMTVSRSATYKLFIHWTDQRTATTPASGGIHIAIQCADASGTTNDPCVILTVTTADSEQIYTTPTTVNQFTVPAGVTVMNKLQAWGAGGGGGVAAGQEAGGGGGAYARAATVSVTPGEILYSVAGAGGGPSVTGADSWIGRNSNGTSPLVLAKGGGGSASTTGGTAGSAGSSVGDVGGVFAGGAGANAQAGGGARAGSGGGGGGGSAAAGGDGGAGASGTAGPAGTAGLPDGGAGGAGGASGASGASGTVPGGGGGGGSNSGNAGSGANGKIHLIWTPAPVASLLFPPSRSSMTSLLMR